MAGSVAKCRGEHIVYSNIAFHSCSCTRVYLMLGKHGDIRRPPTTPHPCCCVKAEFGGASGTAHRRVQSSTNADFPYAGLLLRPAGYLRQEGPLPCGGRSRKDILLVHMRKVQESGTWRECARKQIACQHAALHVWYLHEFCSVLMRI
jgi:hypothetical protein